MLMHSEKQSLRNVDFRHSKKEKAVRNGIRTHAHISGPELESGALDRSATLTAGKLKVNFFVL